MKKVLFTISVLIGLGLSAQTKEPTYEKNEDLVKVTYYHDNGEVREQGFFKDKRLHGTWVKYNSNGEKVTLGNYYNGKKVGKWLFWQDDVLKEVNYDNNQVASVSKWKEASKVAYK
ncbi:toxin-antitoxin system YwqK family antitoxin [Aureivirga marina]|uniref:toxin-antitoxin system YwqK family antitoxin n=1 Tax=Aureivirga marina TaxID=1182451 RepID=UPI0018C90362|nr:nicotinic acid mononucleotide adenyltransferase [Aureivirga marina]